jgi:hypothetical protein
MEKKALFVFRVHCEKKVSGFAVPAWMSLTKLFLAGNNKIIPRLGTGKPIAFSYSVER